MANSIIKKVKNKRYKMKKIIIQTIVLLGTINAFAQPTLESLGAKVNSTYAEVRPTISADGKLIYFVVEGNPKNTMYKTDKFAQDVWFSELDGTGTWGPAKQSAAPINGLKDNAVFWVSPDGNRVLIRGAFENGKYLGIIVFYIKRT